MRGTRRSYREALKPEWADALLRSPSAAEGTIGERVEKAKAELKAALAEIQGVLQEPLAKLVADSQAKEAGRRGQASVVVDEVGDLYLEVTYGSGEAPEPSEASGPKPERSRTWNSTLPKLEDLRAEARSLGIDPAPFGRKRTELLAAIQQKRDSAVPTSEESVVDSSTVETAQPNGASKRVKVADAIGPVTIVDPAVLAAPAAPEKDQERPPPVVDEEVHVPQKRPSVKAPPQPRKGKSLTAIVDEADELDLDAILNR